VGIGSICPASPFLLFFFSFFFFFPFFPSPLSLFFFVFFPLFSFSPFLPFPPLPPFFLSFPSLSLAVRLAQIGLSGDSSPIRSGLLSGAVQEQRFGAPVWRAIVATGCFGHLETASEQLFVAVVHKTISHGSQAEGPWWAFRWTRTCPMHEIRTYTESFVTCLFSWQWSVFPYVSGNVSPLAFDSAFLVGLAPRHALALSLFFLFVFGFIPTFFPFYFPFIHLPFTAITLDFRINKPVATAMVHCSTGR